MSTTANLKSDNHNERINKTEQKSKIFKIDNKDFLVHIIHEMTYKSILRHYDRS